MDKEYFSIKNQQKRIEIREELNSNKKKFKNLIKKNELDLIPYWHELKKDIDLSNLKNHRHKDLNHSDDFTIYIIERHELFRILHPSFKTTFLKSKLWKNHDEDKITRVMENWEKGIKLIPPVIILLPNNNFSIQDGKHRFATANYCEVSHLPIIVLKNENNQFLKLVNKDKIQIVD